MKIYLFLFYDCKCNLRCVFYPRKNKDYSPTCPQWPPWGQKKVAVVEKV